MEADCNCTPPTVQIGNMVQYAGGIRAWEWQWSDKGGGEHHGLKIFKTSAHGPQSFDFFFQAGWHQ